MIYSVFTLLKIMLLLIASLMSHSVINVIYPRYNKKCSVANRGLPIDPPWFFLSRVLPWEGCIEIPVIGFSVTCQVVSTQFNVAQQPEHQKKSQGRGSCPQLSRGSQASSICLPWVLVRNADPQATPDP